MGITDMSEIYNYYVEKMEGEEQLHLLSTHRIKSGSHSMTLLVSVSIINEIILIMKKHKNEMRGILRQTVDKLRLLNGSKIKKSIETKLVNLHSKESRSGRSDNTVIG